MAAEQRPSTGPSPQDAALASFLDGSPLALARLEQAWPHLAVQERHRILSLMLDDSSLQTALQWSHHRRRLLEIAMTDRSAFIRYCAARHVQMPSEDAKRAFRNWTTGESASEATDEDAADSSHASDPRYQAERKLYDQARSDPSSLVQIARTEAGSLWMSYPEQDDLFRFWALPQLERLARVAGTPGDESTIARLIEYATKVGIPAKQVTEEEVLDVLLQYLLIPAWHDFPESPGAGRGGRYSNSDDSSAYRVIDLWRLVPQLAESLAYALLEHLPVPDDVEDEVQVPSYPDFAQDDDMKERYLASTARKRTAFRDAILALNESQLTFLFHRHDIALLQMRRKAWDESSSTELRQAALAHHRFPIVDEDVVKRCSALKSATADRGKAVDELAWLVRYCPAVTAVHLELIARHLDTRPEDLASTERLDSWEAEQACRERLSRIPSYRRDAELADVRLLRVAGNIANGAVTLNSKEVDLVVVGDQWQTYLFLKGTSAREVRQELRDLCIDQDLSDIMRPEAMDRLFGRARSGLEVVTIGLNEPTAAASGLPEWEVVAGAMRALARHADERNNALKASIARVEFRIAVLSALVLVAGFAWIATRFSGWRAAAGLTLLFAIYFWLERTLLREFPQTNREG